LKLVIKHSETIIGEIFANLASKNTREISGILIPTKDYNKFRPNIIKYNEIFHSYKSNNLIDKFLAKQLEKKYIQLKIWFEKFQIIADGTKISNINSEIVIVDSLSKTGLGNLEIGIKAWSLNTDSLPQDFKIYSIEYPYPSEPKRVIEIKYDGELLLKY